MDHLISAKQFRTTESIEELFADANLMRDPFIDLVIGRGKVLAIIKDEGSTRTRVSFEVAMKKLGGDVVLIDLDERTSLSKGESLEDTVRVVSGYVDAIVMRLKTNGAVEKISRYSSVPVINGGDGSSNHPTQALLDLYTIDREMQCLTNLSIMFVGDVAHSRTVNSLLHLLRLYQGTNCVFVSPVGLELSEESRQFCLESGLGVTCYDDLRDALAHSKPNVVYMIREQMERHTYFQFSDKYPIFGKEELTLLGEGSIVMHALPRGRELSEEVDCDHRCAIWRQAQNGLYIRMALLYNVFK